MRRSRVAIAGLLVLGWAADAAADGGCPPGLREAAAAYADTLDRAQREIRGSSLADPRGVEETVQFDLAAHACHRGPGQAYREYGEPVCLDPEGEAGRATVRYPYELRYRKALTLPELFAKAWEEGTDGILQVVFEAEGDRWIPVSRREVLDRGSADGRPGGPKRSTP